jgi:hypothetical protein
MALSPSERDALIGDLVVQLFPSTPPEAVRRIVEWALLVNCGENDDERLVQRWRQVPYTDRSPKALQAVARHYMQVAA